MVPDPVAATPLDGSPPPPRPLGSSGDCLEWPPRSPELRVLSRADWQFWCANGYLVVKDVVPAPLRAAVLDAIHGFLGTRAGEPDSWYRWNCDIYSDVVHEKGGRQARPPHGPCGMVQMCHHASMWAIRQLPAIHDVFCDIYGTHRLWVTSDRCHFKPPERPDQPAWSDAGPVHSGLHWDTNLSVNSWPIPYAAQALVCLTDTPPERGALRVVPGFHRLLEEWTMRRPGDSAHRSGPMYTH